MLIHVRHLKIELSTSEGFEKRKDLAARLEEAGFIVRYDREGMNIYANRQSFTENLQKIEPELFCTVILLLFFSLFLIL